MGYLIAGGVAAALIIPTALTAIFAPEKLRQARDAARDYFMDEDEMESELTRVSEELENLSADIEKRRQSNFADVTAAAQNNAQPG